MNKIIEVTNMRKNYGSFTAVKDISFYVEQGKLFSFFKSTSAFTTASTVIGTLIGFLTGIYLPIGALPASVQTVIKIFPVSHAASLFRQVLMEVPMKNSFEGIPVNYLNEFKEYMGVTFSFGGTAVTPIMSIIILACTAIVFYGLSIFNMCFQS